MLATLYVLPTTPMVNIKGPCVRRSLPVLFDKYEIVFMRMKIACIS